MPPNATHQFAALTLLCAVWFPASAAEVTPAIAGVVNAGTRVQLIQDGFEAVEGPLRDADGSLLFTNNQAGRILRVAPDGSISTWFEAPVGANALARNTSGEIVATLVGLLAIGIVQPGAQPRLLVNSFEGKPFNRPNDLVADRRGNIYFTDSVSPAATGTPAIPSSVYQITADGKLVLVANDIARPNGVALSPDERTLYVANTAGEWVLAYALDEQGTAPGRREFAQLAVPAAAPGAPAANAGGGADGLAVDRAGRLYVASTRGVQVFSPRGEALGIIPVPKQPQNLAFAGPDRATLFVVGRGAVYRIDTLTQGPDRPGK
jgi:gluconolactonase